MSSVVSPLESLTAVAAPAAPARAIAASKRWLALDVFRFAAVCLMVQGHVFSTLLDRATKAEGWYPHHSFVHGYTAPMFLFGAGLAFGATTFAKWEEHANGGPAAIARFSRYGWLLFLGYGLHLPTLSLARLFALEDPERIARMVQVDVLQHIGVSLAICQVLVLLLRDRRLFVSLVAVLSALAIALAPWVWGLDLSAGPLPVWLAGYVNASTGSIFPLVPWVGFTGVGIVVAHAITSGTTRLSDVSRRAAWPLTALALAFMVIPIVLDRFGPYAWPPHVFWKVNPLFTLWRLGNVMAVLAALCFAERLVSRLGLFDPTSRGALGRVTRALVPWVRLVAAESLVVYVAHLVVLHGSVLAPGLKHGELVHEASHGVLGAALVTAVLFAAMVALAKMWSELKKQPFAFRVVQGALLSVLAYLALAG